MSNDDKPSIELFHATTDVDSAAARRHVVKQGLEGRIHFRNVFYAAAQADLKAHGGTHTPAIWDGAQLFEGREKVLAFLDGMAKSQ